MIESTSFTNLCKEKKYHLFTGTPCSYLKPFINNVIDDQELEFIEVTNEGDAVALACGAWLTGMKSIVMFQNSGLGNAVNPLSSLADTMNIPFIGITTLRGEVGGAADEPQHELMGKCTTKVLEALEIKWDYFPSEESEVKELFDKADQYIQEFQKPFFFVMRKGDVNPYELKAQVQERMPFKATNSIRRTSETQFQTTRYRALEMMKETLSPETLFIATTGKTGRELFQLSDDENNLYMVGSMGCALPLGLGISLGAHQNVCVIDGDGSLLMRMGNMALAGQMKPENLIHVLLDNGVHDSTGGQQTFSEQIDFSQIANSCQYQNIYEAGNEIEFQKALKDASSSKKLSFIRFFIKKGSLKELGRPTITPAEVARRMQKAIAKAN